MTCRIDVFPVRFPIVAVDSGFNMIQQWMLNNGYCRIPYATVEHFVASDGWDEVNQVGPCVSSEAPSLEGFSISSVQAVQWFTVHVALYIQ